jgi:hypothetical protein
VKFTSQGQRLRGVRIEVKRLFQEILGQIEVAVLQQSTGDSQGLG